jgi:HPt (histidine-containing phosphotransfer) domain-containing protein
MDEYVPKPIDPKALFDTIERVTGRPSSPELPKAPPASRELSSVLELVEGDVEAARDIVSTFLDDYPRKLQQLEDALAEGDAQAFSRVAHSIKGAVSMFGASSAAKFAGELEQLGRQSQLDGHTQEVVRELLREL